MMVSCKTAWPKSVSRSALALLALLCAPAMSRSEVFEGESPLVWEIYFIGNQSIDYRLLAEQISSTCYRFSLRDGIYSRQMVECDIVRLEEFYRSKGFLNVKVSCQERLVRDEPDRYFLNFMIEEGTRFSNPDGFVVVYSREQQFPNPATRVCSPGSARRAEGRTEATQDTSGVIPVRYGTPCQDTSGVIPGLYMAEDAPPARQPDLPRR